MIGKIVFIVAISAVAGVSGEDVCFTGFIMDRYCIGRGTLLDNPKLNTLDNPARQSFAEHLIATKALRLHSYGLDAHCRPVLCDLMTGRAQRALSR